jgi:hypothetical protein
VNSSPNEENFLHQAEKGNRINLPNAISGEEKEIRCWNTESEGRRGGAHLP